MSKNQDEKDEATVPDVSSTEFVSPPESDETDPQTSPISPDVGQHWPPISGSSEWREEIAAWTDSELVIDAVLASESLSKAGLQNTAAMFSELLDRFWELAAVANGPKPEGVPVMSDEISSELDRISIRE